MADNGTAASGPTVAWDDVGGVAYQRVKNTFGADGVATDVSASAPMPVQQYDPETGLPPSFDSLRRLVSVMPYTMLGDSVVNGFNAWWTTTLANGGTATVTSGEGILSTSANASGSVQLVSPVVPYVPGQVHWFNSAFRVGDTGSAGNIRRWGWFTVSGTTPQDGFAYELNGTALNIVTYRGGTATTTAVASWSKVTTAPFTLDTSYHQWEVQSTANSAYFYVDKVLRHIATGGANPLTAALDLPMAMQNINSSGATDRVLAVRNIGVGRFGTQPARLAGPTAWPRSGTITLGGTAQVLAAANGDRAGLTIQNTDATADLWFTEDGSTTAALNTGYRLPAGATAQISTQKAISIWGATTGQKFAATEF